MLIPLKSPSEVLVNVASLFLSTTIFTLNELKKQPYNNEFLEATGLSVLYACMRKLF